MRWQQLFADLEAQYAAAAAAGDHAEAASRRRAEVGALRLTDRLRGAVGKPVSLSCRGAGRVTGVLADVGPDWLLLDDERGREVLVAAGVLTAVAGLGRRTGVPEEGHVWARMDLRRALRGLARDRSAVQVLLDDGSELRGTVDRVGADYVELAEHALDRPRRTEAVQGVRAVVIDAIAVVRAAGVGLD